jgi:hypothetical protein
MAGLGKTRLKRPWIRHCRRSSPYSPRISRRFFATIPAGRLRAAVAAARGPGLGEVAPGPARAGGRGAVLGRQLAIICKKFAGLCLFKPSPESEHYPPAKKSVGRRAGSGEGFWDDCPLPCLIVRMAGAAARVSPPGGTGPESPAPPGRGRRPGHWARELARSRD